MSSSNFEDIRRQQQELDEQERQQRMLEEAKASQEQAAESQPQPSSEEDNKGIITRLGETLDYITDGGPSADVVNAGAAALNQLSGGRLQGLDDTIQGYDEQKEVRDRILQGAADRSSEGEATLSDQILLGGTGITQGTKAGLLAPLTLAGVATGQDTPWSRAPEVIKDHAVADSLFQITEIVSGSLIYGGAARAAGAGAGAVLVGESVIEAGVQDDLGETLGGEFVADRLGEVASFLGEDGEALAQELKDGETFNSQAFFRAYAFAESLGMNWSVDKFIKLFPQIGKPSDEVVRAAEISGKNVDEVNAAVRNINEPVYKPDHEPHELLDEDTLVPVSKPTPGNEYISEDALRAEMLRDVGLDDELLTSSQRAYWTNLKPLSSEEGIRKAIKEISKSFEPLAKNSDDIAKAARRAHRFWDANAHLIDRSLTGEDFIKGADVLAEDFADVANRMVQNTDQLDAEAGVIFGRPVTRDLLTQKARTTAAGNMVAAAIGEEISVRIQKAAQGAANLESKGIDFTAQVENLIKLHEKAENFYVPLRRAKRADSVSFRTQQRAELDKLKRGVESGVTPKPDKSVSSDRITAIRKDEADVGKTIREMWDAAQAGDEDALATLKEYITFIANTNPANVLSDIDNLSNILHREFMKGNSDARNNLMYGFFLSRVSTQVAANASNLLQMMLQPVGAILSGESAYGVGQLVGGLAHFQEALGVGMRAFRDNAPVNAGRRTPQDLLSLKDKAALIERQYQTLKAQHIQEGKPTFGLTLSRNLPISW